MANLTRKSPAHGEHWRVSANYSLSEGLASLREHHQEVTCSWRALASFGEHVRYSELL
ncbi:hypothetical protein L195_g063390, partial [Trifolium pratense]